MSTIAKPAGPAEILGSESTRALTARPQRLGPYVPDAPRASAEDIERALTLGDLSKMTPEVRVRFYIAACESASLNYLTRPFTPMKTQSGEVVLYANVQAAEQLRQLHRLSIKVLSRVTEEGLYTVTVQGRMPDGREDEAQGIVEVAKLQGLALANARMRAESKAKRRLTLAMIGLGFGLADDADGLPVPLNMQTGDLDGTPRPVAHVETVSLDQHIEDLTGQPPAHQAVPSADTPAGPLAGDYVAQIEALLVTHGRTIPAFWGWAEKQKKKPQGAFSGADYADLLVRVQADVQKKRAQQAATEASTAMQGELSAHEMSSGMSAPVDGILEPPGGLPDDNGANVAWRGMLAGLLPSLDDATLAQEAGSVLENADATDSEGNEMVSRVLNALEAQDERAEQPF